jgi:hypothetical protein
MVVSLLVLIGLVKFLQMSQSPLSCAVIYAIITFLFSFSLITVAIAFVLSFIYFWLLHRFENSVLWWVILIVGGFGLGMV